MLFDLRVVVKIVRQGCELSLPRAVAFSQTRAGGEIALVNNSQSFQRQCVVDLGNELRFASDQSRQTAGGDTLRLRTKLRNHSLQDAVDQPNVSIEQSYLQVIHGV